MQYTSLGRSGLQVSRFSLGTMNFGMVADEAASFEIMDEALEAGINFFDTADVYGGPQSPDMEQGYGLSEEIIGRWLNQGNRRDRIVLATKVYQPMGTDPNVAVAEQQLLPVVRAASRDAAILADGYSCRTQLADLTRTAGPTPRGVPRRCHRSVFQPAAGKRRTGLEQGLRSVPLPIG